MLSKKHYVAIAKLLYQQHTCYPLSAPQAGHPHMDKDDTCRRLASYFTSDNPRFDRARFLQACGVEPGEDG